jgi:hypothetical protein
MDCLNAMAQISRHEPRLLDAEEVDETGIM